MPGNKTYMAKTEDKRVREFNRTIRDLRRQLQRAKRRKGELESLDDELKATKAQLAELLAELKLETKWWLVDATDKVVGRLASDIAVVLMGKDKPTYTPHVDTGDFVVVTNVEKVVFTGKKWDQKRYTWYTGYPGQKSESAADRRERQPEMILREAVRRMLPKNKLGARMLQKLKLCVGDTHPHQAQTPKPRDLGTKKG